MSTSLRFGCYEICRICIYLFAATIIWMSNIGVICGRVRCSAVPAAFRAFHLIRGSVSFTMTELHAKNSLNVQRFLLSTPVTFWVVIRLHTKGRKMFNLEVAFDQPCVTAHTAKCLFLRLKRREGLLRFEGMEIGRNDYQPYLNKLWAVWNVCDKKLVAA